MHNHYHVNTLTYISELYISHSRFNARISFIITAFIYGKIDCYRFECNASIKISLHTPTDRRRVAFYCRLVLQTGG
jgi:hypothetical protein